MADTFFVSVDMPRAIERMDAHIVGGSITGECIDRYDMTSPAGQVTVLVYEKHYYRAGNRLTLTVTLDNLTGQTRVHSAAGGGGEGLFRFDWGAADSFAQAPSDALRQFVK